MARHARPGLLAMVATFAVVGAGFWVATGNVRGAVGERPSPSASPLASASPSPTVAPSPTPVANRPVNTAFEGITTFRGNWSRSWYGEGPIPRTKPEILWRYPRSGSLCMKSAVPGDPEKVWCGTGWTGQPNVIVGDDGSIEIRIGAYDGHYHFLDGLTGEPVRPDLVTRDLAKGSASSDPDGFPLYYGGSRDNHLRVVALDRPEPTVLWELDANTSVPDPRWNDDWDGAPLVVGDYLLEGGENSWFYVIRLNRGYGADGLVTVDPQVVFTTPGWDDELLKVVRDGDLSIENSVAFRDGVAYFANSAGLVQGWDISDVLAGGTTATRVFRFWTGDDTDASVVIDPDGFLYVASELQRYDARSSQVGQLLKLDPRNPDDPLVWSLEIKGRGSDGLGGIWATPALWRGSVIVGTNAGDLLSVDAATGEVLWTIHLGGPVWGSAVPIGNTLLQGDCKGYLHAYDLSGDPRKPPPELWNLRLDGCVESTPAVWKGRIWVGTRGGGVFGIG